MFRVLAGVHRLCDTHLLYRRISGLQLDMKINGKVKFFDTTKGFGFITPDGVIYVENNLLSEFASFYVAFLIFFVKGGVDIFVHQSAVYAEGFRSLAEGEAVEFDIVEDAQKGKTYAANVTGPNGSFVQGAPRQDRGGDRGESRGRFSERY